MHALVRVELGCGKGPLLPAGPQRCDDSWPLDVWSTHPTAGEYLTRFTFRPTAAKDGCRRINGHGELETSAQPLGVRVLLIDFLLIFGSCRVTLMIPKWCVWRQRHANFAARIARLVSLTCKIPVVFELCIGLCSLQIFVLLHQQNAGMNQNLN